MTILLNPGCSALSDYLKTIPRVFEQQGEDIYVTRNHIKRMTAPDGTVVIVKRYHPPKGLNRLVYSLGIRKPKGKRAYCNAFLLGERGITTPGAIAYIEERRHAMITYSYFVSEYCVYPHTMYEMERGIDDYPRLDLFFARFTARMHNSGVMHKDYSPGNILWTKTEGADGQPAYRFAIVDTNRMRFGSVGMRCGCRSLRRLWGPKSFFVSIARAYARERGYDEDRCEAIALKARARFWKRYIRRHEAPTKIEF